MKCKNYNYPYLPFKQNPPKHFSWVAYPTRDLKIKEGDLLGINDADGYLRRARKKDYALYSAIPYCYNIQRGELCVICYYFDGLNYY